VTIRKKGRREEGKKGRREEGKKGRRKGGRKGPAPEEITVAYGLRWLQTRLFAIPVAQWPS